MDESFSIYRILKRYEICGNKDDPITFLKKMLFHFNGIYQK